MGLRPIKFLAAEEQAAVTNRTEAAGYPKTVWRTRKTTSMGPFSMPISTFEANAEQAGRDGCRDCVQALVLRSSQSAGEEVTGRLLGRVVAIGQHQLVGGLVPGFVSLLGVRIRPESDW
jgi:hypothetical protein